MVDFPVSGEALKRLVKKSRTVPIAFGYNPGTMDEDDEYFAAHALKAPEVLGKLARAEGAGSKTSFGTFTALGAEIRLTCFRTIPQMAKRLKKFLKANKIVMNVVVLDPDGNVIDTDVETLEEWFEEPEEADEEAEAETEEPSPAELAAETAPDPAADPAELAVRLKALAPAVKAAPGDVAARVQQGFAGAMALMKVGRLAEAESAISRLELVAARLEHLARAAPPAPPPPQPAPEAPKGPDPAALDRLSAVIDRLAEQVAAGGAGAAALAGRLDAARGHARAGEAEAALGLMRQVTAGLDELAAARTKWDKAAAILAPSVETALGARSVADPDTLRRNWGQAVELAAQGDHARAVALLPGISALLRAPAAAPAATGVVAFQRARVLWAGTRSRMMDEARKLSAAIVAQSADDPDAPEIARAAEGIVARVARIDERLEDLLDRITNAEPDDRGPLKAEAAQVAARYQAMLGQGIFTVIDANPFAPVSVAASARAALASISRTLA